MTISVDGMTASIDRSRTISSDLKRKRKKKKCHLYGPSSRTLALEQAYVHDVYSVIATNRDLASSPVRSHVKDFLLNDFEVGNTILDIGCGDGKYLDLMPDLIMFGLDYCPEWFHSQSESSHLLVGSVLQLPFRDELFDGVLCCGVLHHISTLERRIKALKEIARTLKIGGKLLLTVTSRPNDVKDIESQDVLIKVNNFIRNSSNNCSASDFDSTSFSSSSSSSSGKSTMAYKAYGTTHHSPTNSEFENCYSFVKKALKRFSLNSSISMKNSNNLDSNSESKMSANMSINEDWYPIELRNLEEDNSSFCSSKSSSTTGDSALSSFNRSSGCISQTSSNSFFPTSLMSAIKEHLISWKVQFANSFENWQLSEGKNIISGESGSASAITSSFNHRFSLPISFRRTGKSDSLNSAKNILSKNKVYAFNGFENSIMQNFFAKYENKDVELNLTNVVHAGHNGSKEMINDKPLIVASKNEKSGANFTFSNNKIIFQKSFSSESSRQASIQCSDYKLIAYYSMPELRTLFSTGDDFCMGFSERLKSPKIYPITFMIRPQKQNSADADSGCVGIDDNEDIPSTAQNFPVNESTIFVEPEQAMSHQEPINSDIDNLMFEEMKENPSTLQQSNQGKFPKKLLRQRSFSADYQPEVVKFQPEIPRRFSASPNIGTHRYNNNNHTPHQQQISIDSEESFVTIIPANRSNRDSIADVNISDNLTDFEFEEECTSNEDISPNVSYDSYSSSDDDAYCENLCDDQQSSNDTSVSSVLEATVKSVSKSDSNEFQTDISMGELSGISVTPSPPTILHRYYHLFRKNELEQLIEEHVQNIHIIDSYYDDCAMSWCIVGEKIHVWTI